jgi:glutaredoxin
MLNANSPGQSVPVSASITPPSSINTVVGFLMFACGLLGFAASAIVQSDGKFMGLERWIAPAPVLWGVGMLIIAGMGLRLTWGQAHPRVDWSPTIPGQRFQSVVLYTRQNCHLCDEALELLSRYQTWLPAVVEVDIDTDAALQQRFNTSVPVIECDGKVRFRGRISELLLQRLLEGTKPQ